MLLKRWVIDRETMLIEPGHKRIKRAVGKTSDEPTEEPLPSDHDGDRGRTPG
jgi:hypothetical protein